jgi:hypothetical protein
MSFSTFPLFLFLSIMLSNTYSKNMATVSNYKIYVSQHISLGKGLTTDTKCYTGPRNRRILSNMVMHLRDP